jgi:hypothetical protein
VVKAIKSAIAASQQLHAMKEVIQHVTALTTTKSYIKFNIYAISTRYFTDHPYLFISDAQNTSTRLKNVTG